jgi:hypothetical protein
MSQDAFDRARTSGLATDGTPRLSGAALHALVDRLVKAGIGQPLSERLAFDKPSVCVKQLEYLPFRGQLKAPGRLLALFIERDEAPPADYGVEKSKEAKMPSDRKVYLKFPAVIELLECAAAKRQGGELLTQEEWAAGMWRTTGIPTCHLLVREQYLGRGEWFTAPKIADKAGPWYEAIGQERMTKAISMLEDEEIRTIALNYSKGIYKTEYGDSVRMKFDKLRAGLRTESARGDTKLDTNTRRAIEAELAGKKT